MAVAGTIGPSIIQAVHQEEHGLMPFVRRASKLLMYMSLRRLSRESVRFVSTVSLFNNALLAFETHEVFLNSADLD